MTKQKRFPNEFEDEAVPLVGTSGRTKRQIADDLIIIDRPRPAGSGLVQQPFDTILQKATSPLANHMLVHAQLGCDHLALDAVRAAQDDPASLRHRPSHPSPAHLPFQILALFRFQKQSAVRRPPAFAMPRSFQPEPEHTMQLTSVPDY